MASACGDCWNAVLPDEGTYEDDEVCWCTYKNNFVYTTDNGCSWYESIHSEEFKAYVKARTYGWGDYGDGLEEDE